MADSSTFLTLEEVNELLPDTLKIDFSLKKVDRSVFYTVNGKLLPILNSRLYPDLRFWYSSLTSYYISIGAEYICFTAGLLGIYLIPINIVEQHNRTSGWKCVGKKGRHYHVRLGLTESGTSYINAGDRYNPHKQIDITDYFVASGSAYLEAIAEHRRKREEAAAKPKLLGRRKKEPKPFIEDDDEIYDFDFDFV